MLQKALSTFILLQACILLHAQGGIAKGKLFIIGGGHCPPGLLHTMVDAAGVKASDYIVLLPMSSAYPDTAFLYFKEMMQPVTTASIVDFNFTERDLENHEWLDSLKKAKLIFISGGDQARFMKIVAGSPIDTAIRQAFYNGATIAGTSAGAAVMSEQMITGNQLVGDTVYRSTFNKLVKGNIEFSRGLGMVKTMIVDQHFVVRSRYNRLLSALAAFPRYQCVGIDESTAILISGRTVNVVGEGQVLIFSNPVGMSVTKKGLLKFGDINLSVLTAGDQFMLK